jgi:hypothetical protein
MNDFNEIVFLMTCFGILFTFFQAVFIHLLSTVKNDIRDITSSFKAHLNDHARGHFKQ